MDIRKLNSLFDPAGRPMTEGLPTDVIHVGSNVSDESDVVVHEYQIDDTIVFVPDGTVSRENGAPRLNQSIDASLAVQGRVVVLQGEADNLDHRLFIYNPNPEDGYLTTTTGYANGINTLAVDDGSSFDPAELASFGDGFSSRGGEIRSGGKVYTVIEDEGVGSPVSLVDVEFSASTKGPGIRISVADGKSLATDAVTTYVGGKVAELFLPDDPRIGLSAFGPSAVIDEHGDGLRVVGSVVGIVVKDNLFAAGLTIKTMNAQPNVACIRSLANRAVAQVMLCVESVCRVAVEPRRWMPSVSTFVLRQLADRLSCHTC